MKRIFLGYPFALKYVRPTVERAVGDLAKVLAADDRLRARPLLIKIEEMIEEADLCLFDLTQHNANVAAEFGIAYKSGKKWAILYCTDEQLNPKPGSESSVFSDLKGWDSILYRDPEHLELELRRLLPEYLDTNHVRLGTVQSKGFVDISVRPRLNLDLKTNYAAAIGHLGGTVEKLGEDTLSVEIRNTGNGMANDVRVTMTGIAPVQRIQAIEPGRPVRFDWPLEDQQGYRQRAQLPAIRVEYQDDNGVRYEQVGSIHAVAQSGGTFHYRGSGLLPPTPIDDYTLPLS